ncbi:hypothetical protein Q5O24_04360 [Eubacteriaceae bacterium ES3]|nr:hypothetical protein Q5O24_04360 [Eubacteriaceae bacterium ES3]
MGRKYKYINYKDGNMLITIKDQVLEFDSEKGSSQKLLNEINQVCQKNNWEIDYLIIDGQHIAEDWLHYIEENFFSVRDVIVVVNHLDVLISETLNSTYEYVKNGFSLINELSESFYQKPDSRDWSLLANLFEGIEWIISVQEKIDEISNLDQLIRDYSIWNEVVFLIGQLKNNIMEINHAMENQDLVLIGDLLQYEVMPIFTEIAEKLSLIVTVGENDYVS